MSATATRCLYEQGKKVRLFPHRRGFTAYSLEQGSSTVLMLNVDETRPDSSVRYGRELVMELYDTPPLGQVLEVKKWAPVTLYKFGGPQIQFESLNASGTLLLSSLTANSMCHGQLHLFFTDPTIDKTNAGKVELKLSF